MARQASPHSDFDTSRSCAQPVRRVHHLRPGRVGPAQVGLQPRCQPHQLVRMQLQHPARLRAVPAAPVPADGATASPAGALHFLVSNYRILFRIQDLVCRYIGGVGFPAPRGRNSLLRSLGLDRDSSDFQALPRRTLPPLQALDAKRHLLGPLDRS